jgi:hypothetical protein
VRTYIDADVTAIRRQAGRQNVSGKRSRPAAKFENGPRSIKSPKPNKFPNRTGFINNLPVLKAADSVIHATRLFGREKATSRFSVRHNHSLVARHRRDLRIVYAV